jgi:hypothetical protein
MNEIIRDYICQTSCNVVNKLQKGFSACHPSTNGWKPHWHFISHIGMCVKSDMEISCKEVAYSYMWIAPYIWYCIQYRVFVAIVAICMLALKVV